MEGDTVKFNRTVTLTGCAIVAGLILGGFLLISPMAYGAQQACSAEKLQGRYVFTGQGTNLHYGAFDFDGAGKFLGKQTSLRDKTSIQREALGGTYHLDADPRRSTGRYSTLGRLCDQRRQEGTHDPDGFRYDGRPHLRTIASARSGGSLPCGRGRARVVGEGAIELRARVGRN